MKLHDAIVEKDFRVCFTLDYLFHRSPWKEHITFKGRTSLSKAFDPIHRFSEDIDLILGWQLLDTANKNLEQTVPKQNMACSTRKPIPELSNFSKRTFVLNCKKH